jgi:hypothetical protein
MYMTPREELLARFAGEGGAAPYYLPDMTLWYASHKSRKTMPAGWEDYDLTQVAGALGAPVWASARPWRVEYAGIEVRETHSPAERTTLYETPAGALTARWTLGPDGDWWQTEYPVKGVTDLPAARLVVEGLTYHLDADRWTRMDAQVGAAGVVALELPRRPYSDLLHDFLGWSEGLMLIMGEGREALLEMAGILEAKLQELTTQIAGLPGTLALAPDNLDGQYISPRVFAAQMAESYRRSVETLGAAGKPLIVHIGGPARRILGPLAATGVAGAEGVAGPPQSDASLSEAREAAGAALTLWGGIPQDFLAETTEEEKLDAAIQEALHQAAGDPRVIIGVADRVPTGAAIGRLLRIRDLIK